MLIENIVHTLVLSALINTTCQNRNSKHGKSNIIVFAPHFYVVVSIVIEAWQLNNNTLIAIRVCQDITIPFLFDDLENGGNLIVLSGVEVNLELIAIIHSKNIKLINIESVPTIFRNEAIALKVRNILSGI